MLLRLLLLQLLLTACYRVCFWECCWLVIILAAACQNSCSRSALTLQIMRWLLPHLKGRDACAGRREERPGMWKEQLKFQLWNVRGHPSAESRLALMGSKESKQPQRWCLFGLWHRCYRANSSEIMVDFCVVLTLFFFLLLKSQCRKSWTKERMFSLDAKAGGSCRAYLHSARWGMMEEYIRGRGVRGEVSIKIQ